MNISLTPEIEQLIREKVSSGLYASEDEVIAVAMRLLDDRDRSTAQLETVGEMGSDPGDFAALPFFGMAAGRDEFADSEAWVRRSRESWQQRASRPD